MTIKKRVDTFKTKYKEGFINSEIEDILKEYPEADLEVFNNTLYGVTVRILNNEMVVFHNDVELALRKSMFATTVSFIEFD